MDNQIGDRDEQIDRVAILGEPLRRTLYDYVVQQGRDVGRDEAAGAAGISRGLAGFHLDKLVDEGLLEATYQRLTGRTGPGAGRPSKMYSRSERQIDLSLPPRRYELAARLFAETLARENASGERAMLEDVASQAGEQIGEKAREVGHRSMDNGKPLEKVTETLEAYGYAPYHAGRDEIRLRNCPFHELSQNYRQLVCGANLSLMRGFATGLDLKGVNVELEPRPGECCVVFRTTPT